MDKAWLVQRFAQIPSDIRSRITTADYSHTERVCPQKMPIGQLMKDAYAEFSGTENGTGNDY